MRLKVSFFLCTITATVLFAQSKSSIQFYDSTGANKTAKIGWTGANGGQFVVQTPGDNTGMAVKSGNVTVNGTVTATGFSGNGSGLTNITATPTAHVHPQSDITGLNAALGAKADTAYVNTKVSLISVPSLAGIRDTLKMKADTNHTHSAMVTTVNASGGLSASTSGQTVTISGKLRPIGGNNGSTDSLARADHSHPAAGIGDGAIDSAKIAADAVRGSHIKDGTIAAPDLANGIVDSSKIAPAAVGTYHLRNNAVTSAKIADGTIGGADLATSIVDSSKMAAASVGAYHLRDNAVTGAKIADGTIYENDLSSELAGKISAKLDSNRRAIAFGSSVQDVSFVINSTIALSLIEIPFVAPVNGAVILNASANLRWYQVTSRYALGGITVNTTELTPSDGMYAGSPSSSAEEDFWTFAQTRYILVSKGQTYTFRLLFRKVVDGNGDYSVRSLRLNGIFIPD